MLNQKTSFTFDLQRFANDTQFNIATGNTVLSSSAVSLSASQIQTGTLPVARGGTGKTDLSQVTVGTATTANSATTATTAGSLTTARALQVSLGKTSATDFQGNANVTNIGVQGILPVANGGTGATTAKAVFENIKAGYTCVQYQNGTATNSWCKVASYKMDGIWADSALILSVKHCARSTGSGILVVHIMSDASAPDTEDSIIYWLVVDRLNLDNYLLQIPTVIGGEYILWCKVPNANTGIRFTVLDCSNTRSGTALGWTLYNNTSSGTQTAAPTGGTIKTSTLGGNVATANNVSGVVAIANGGTGQTTAALARNALGLGNTTGALPVANGGTGMTANPSMLTNLESTAAASVFAASPRPGVTGTLGVANGGTGATVLSAITVGKANSLTTARALQVSLSSTGAPTFNGTADVKNIGVQGILGIANGGTGVTVNPSMLTDLGSTTAANVFAASPKPGITGTLPVAHGGTGATVLSAVTVGKATTANSLTTARSLQVSLNNTSATNFQGNANVTNIGVQGVLQIAQGGTGQTTAAAVRNALGLGNTTDALPVANGGTGTNSLANITVGAATKDGSGNVITSYYTPLLVTPTIASGSNVEENICNIPSACTNNVNAAINLNMANFNSIKSGMYTCQVSVGATGATSSKPWFNVLSVRHRNGQGDGRNYGMIFYSIMQNDGDLYWRHQCADGWRTERKIIDSSNIGSQTVAACTGNALTASSLQTARSLQVSLNKTTATNFQGNANVTNIGVQGTLGVANGGTGATVLTAVTVGKANTLTTARALQVSLSNTGAPTFDGTADVKTIGVQGVLQVAQGGTGQTTAAATRNALGLGNTTGALPIANGGTGQTTAAAARNALGLGNTTGALPVANGGTGQTTAAAARNALGLGNTTGALPVANGGTGATTAINAFQNIKAGYTCVQYQGGTVTNSWYKVASYKMGGGWSDSTLILAVKNCVRNAGSGILVVHIMNGASAPDTEGSTIYWLVQNKIKFDNFLLQIPTVIGGEYILWCKVPNANTGIRFTVLDCSNTRSGTALGWTLYNNTSGGTQANVPAGGILTVSMLPDDVITTSSHYGTCSTKASNAAKVVACSDYMLRTGSRITVKFTVTNTAANPTLDVNNTGAKAIYYRGAAVPASALQANSTYDFVYDGTQYDIIGYIT